MFGTKNGSIRGLEEVDRVGDAITSSACVGVTASPIDRVLESTEPLTREVRQHCILSYKIQRELAKQIQIPFSHNKLDYQ